MSTTTFTLTIDFDDAGLPVSGRLSSPEWGESGVDRSTCAALLNIKLPPGRQKGSGEPSQPTVIPTGKGSLGSLLATVRKHNAEFSKSCKELRSRGIRSVTGAPMGLADASALALLADPTFDVLAVSEAMTHLPAILAIFPDAAKVLPSEDETNTADA